VKAIQKHCFKYFVAALREIFSQKSSLSFYIKYIRKLNELIGAYYIIKMFREYSFQLIP